MSVRPQLVGIVNITPDSFSDGGEYFTPLSALQAVEQLIEDGASVVDIGAESTRPGAEPLSWMVEWNRLEPVMTHLAGAVQGRAHISVDSRHAETITEALPYGIHWVNDVSGFGSPDMVRTVADAECTLVVMHSLTVPANKDVVLAEDCDPVLEVLAWAENRIAALVQAGIAKERIIFDPGVGFGKTGAQSVALLKNISAFHVLGVPLLVGHSRKSFLPMWGGSEDRDAATLEVSQYLMEQGVAYLRVHDVAAHAALEGV
ncbi:MAG: dihydropteroate synthase [Rickettsiales bacterium]|nr:dihydropteroate synthase [Rickettsiales bacterium]